MYSKVLDNTKEYSKTQIDGKLNNKWVFGTTIFNGQTSNVQTATNEAIGNASSLLICLRWKTYKISNVLLLKGSYHFIFDNNNTLHTAVCTWNNNTVNVTYVSDVYIDSISDIIPLA